MTAWYIKDSTYGTNEPHIVDEKAIDQAEHGMNYLNADEFTFLCEADCLDDAKEYYWEVFSRMANDYMAEYLHP